MKIIAQDGIEAYARIDDLRIERNKMVLYGRVIYEGNNVEAMFKKICDFEKSGLPVINLGGC